MTKPKLASIRTPLLSSRARRTDPKTRQALRVTLPLQAPPGTGDRSSDARHNRNTHATRRLGDDSPGHSPWTRLGLAACTPIDHPTIGLMIYVSVVLALVIAVVIGIAWWLGR